MTKIITIAAIIGAFILGTGAFSLVDASPASDAAFIAALDGIRDAILGIDPDVTVNPTPVNINVDPTPITINAPQGEKGDKGDQGDKGETGAKGDKGDTGADANISTYHIVTRTTLQPGASTGQYYSCHGSDTSMSMGYALVDKDTHVANVNNFDTRGFFAATNFGTGPDEFNIILTCFDMPVTVSKSLTSETVVPDPNVQR